MISHRKMDLLAFVEMRDIYVTLEVVISMPPIKTGFQSVTGKGGRSP
jgi:hypothetical protein